jgi:L-ascorbate metabolism protein UlaG (beta-lactamase superfamily)
MKMLYWLAGIVIVLVVGFYALNAYIYNEKQGDSMDQSLAQVIPITHASAVITLGDATIYTDPTGDVSLYASKPKATIVLVTDIHSDHLSTSTLEAVMGSSTALIVPQAVKDMLPPDLASRAKVLANGSSMTEQNISIAAVPMYNIPESQTAFHTKGRGNGYVLEWSGTRVYIAGDTSATPEMKALSDIDVALVPMNLPYTMSIDEAAQGVLAFKPKVVYPYHYRGPDGLSDVNKFKELVNAGDPSIDVVLLNWYPN